MSTKNNDRYLEELRQQLVTAIEIGDRQKELEIREELEDCGLISKESLELLEETL